MCFVDTAHIAVYLCMLCLFVVNHRNPGVSRDFIILDKLKDSILR